MAIGSEKCEGKVGHTSEGYQDKLLHCLHSDDPKTCAVSPVELGVHNDPVAYAKNKKIEAEQSAAKKTDAGAAEDKPKGLIFPSDDNVNLASRLEDTDRICRVPAEGLKGGIPIQRRDFFSSSCSVLRKSKISIPTGSYLLLSADEMRDLSRQSQRWWMGASCIEDQSKDNLLKAVQDGEKLQYRTSWNLATTTDRDDLAAALQKIRSLKAKNPQALDAKWEENRIKELEGQIAKAKADVEDGATKFMEQPFYEKFWDGLWIGLGFAVAGGAVSHIVLKHSNRGGGGGNPPAGGAGSGSSTSSAPASQASEAVQMTATAATAGAGLWAATKASLSSAKDAVGNFLQDHKDVILPIAGTAAAIGIGASLISGGLVADDATVVGAADDPALLGTVPVAIGGLAVAAGLYALVGEEFHPVDKVTSAAENIL